MGKPIKAVDGITYIPTSKNGEVKISKDSDGFIRIIGHDVKVMLPENYSSKIRVGSKSPAEKTNNIKIVDGKENKGYHSDQVYFVNASNVEYVSAPKNRESKSKMGDYVEISEGEFFKVTVRANDLVYVAPANGDTRAQKHVFIKAAEGAKVHNFASDTVVKNNG